MLIANIDMMWGYCDFRKWPISEVTPRLMEVRLFGHSDFLTLSSSHFDPQRTLRLNSDRRLQLSKFLLQRRPAVSHHNCAQNSTERKSDLKNLTSFASSSNVTLGSPSVRGSDVI